MAITKAAILAEVNDNLLTNLTDIDKFIQKTLDDLSEMDFLVGEDTSQTLENGDETLDEPTGMRSVIDIVLILNSIDQHPLIKLKGGHQEYRSLRHNDDSVGIPRWYSRFAAKFFLWRPANQDFTSRIEYYKDHPALSGDSGSIEFKDIFKNVIFAGATFYTALKFQRTQAINVWGLMYESAKQKRDDATYRNPRIVRG